MKFFWCQGIFFRNFDFKNGCKNEFEDNNKKLEAFKNEALLKSILEPIGLTAWEVGHLFN